MFGKHINTENLKVLVFLPLVAIMSIGRYYDERLQVGPLNITIVLTVAFLVSFVIQLPQIIKSKLSKQVILLFSFVFIVNYGLWLVWGVNDINDYSLNKSVTMFMLSMPICVYAASLKGKKEIQTFLLAFSVVGLFLTLLGSMSLLSGAASEGRLAVLGGGPIVFSRWIGSFVIVSAFLYPLHKLLKLIIVLIGAALMMLSGSKGPLLFLLMCSVLLYLKDKRLYLVILVFIAIGLIFLSDLIVFMENIPGLARIFGLGEASNIVSGTSSTARVHLITDSIETINNNPLGHGLGNFSRFSDFDNIHGKAGYPHNIFLEIFIELGIFVFLLFSYFCYKSIRYSIKNLLDVTKRNNMIKTVAILFLFFLLNTLVSGDLSDARYLMLFTVLIFRLKED